MGRRTITVHLWTGALILQRLGPADPDPTQDDLDALADEWTARNGGVRPSVRILETTPDRRRIGVGGPPGRPGSSPARLFRKR